jgi:hypothetical protein
MKTTQVKKVSFAKMRRNPAPMSSLISDHTEKKRTGYICTIIWKPLIANVMVTFLLNLFIGRSFDQTAPNFTS